MLKTRLINMDDKQLTNKVIMVEPRGFYANPQTLASNAHQRQDETPKHIIQEKALIEHRRLVQILRDEHILVNLITGQAHTPDDLFCNNWISFHEDTVVLYPMLALNRREERREDLCQQFCQNYDAVLDLSHYENSHQYLESTGSIVLDRRNKKAYAALSSRTDKSIFLEWCQHLAYEPIAFLWTYPNREPVYHTNVIMFIGSSVVGICEEGIEPTQRALVMDNLRSHHEVVSLSYQQIERFSGNAIELSNTLGQKLLFMSTNAFNALTPAQLEVFQKHVDKIVHSDISTIEQYGGGSVRCLILEQF